LLNFLTIILYNKENYEERMKYFSTIISIICAILGISFIICIHELGHFFAAKFFGVQVPTFSIGFGPSLVSFNIGETTFQISAILLGGYVNINPEEMAAQSYWIKMLIILAGIAINILFAYLVWFYLIWRKPTQAIPEIDQIVSDSPAETAHLQKGDYIVACNNIPLNNKIEPLISCIKESAGKTIPFTIKRNTQEESVLVRIGEHPTYGTAMGWLGAQFKSVPSEPLSIAAALKKATRTFLNLLNLLGIFHTLNKKENGSSIIGPIGIIWLISKSAQMGISFFLLILASLSLNIAFFNMLPLPFLDGGQALSYTIHALSKDQAGGNFAQLIYKFIVALFIAFLIYITFKDVRRMRKK